MEIRIMKKKEGPTKIPKYNYIYVFYVNSQFSSIKCTIKVFVYSIQIHAIILYRNWCNLRETTVCNCDAWLHHLSLWNVIFEFSRSTNKISHMLGDKITTLLLNLIILINASPWYGVSLFSWTTFTVLHFSFFTIVVA